MKNRKVLFIPALIFLSLISISSIRWTDSKDRTLQYTSFDTIQNLELSTADLYKSDEFVFIGDFVESRSNVDFNYHNNYQLERQLFQDCIVRKYLEFGKSVDSPKIIFTAGVMGAGKGHVLKKMVNSGEIHIQDYLWIDPDQLKEELPEMRSYVLFDPKTAGTKVHKESGFIEEIILAEALKRNKNIIVDGSLTSLVQHKTLF